MGDYIRIEDAVDAVKHAWAKGIEPSQYIESIEPVDVVPVVHGHWIPYRCDMYECSVCKRIHTSMDVEGCDAEYCPHCGALMDANGEE